MAFAYLFGKFISRFRYPVSLPEDVAKAVGVPLSNLASFEQILTRLTATTSYFSRLRRRMSRSDVERLFQAAVRKEHFPGSAIFSFSFPTGWLEFSLQFDRDDRLRRAYVDHRGLEDRVELPLAVEV